VKTLFDIKTIFMRLSASIFGFCPIGIPIHRRIPAHFTAVSPAPGNSDRFCIIKYDVASPTIGKIQIHTALAGIIIYMGAIVRDDTDGITNIPN